MSRVWLITGGSRGLGRAVAEATPAPRQHVFVLASVSMRHRKHPAAAAGHGETAEWGRAGSLSRVRRYRRAERMPNLNGTQPYRRWVMLGPWSVGHLGVPAEKFELHSDHVVEALASLVDVVVPAATAVHFAALGVVGDA